jgi:hypothetical protein
MSGGRTQKSEESGDSRIISEEGPLGPFAEAPARRLKLVIFWFARRQHEASGDFEH